ncbi:MAG: dienelactone hydrolase family protein [Alphaproteobacteria bacterium]
MSGRDIVLTAADGGSFGAYLAAPASGAGAGMVVLQEIFGVNKVMRDLADGLSSQGYFAIVPDLFWRQEPGIQLTDQTAAEWARAFELYQGFDEDLGIEDATAALDHVRAAPGCTGKVGSVGYCLGGKLAYLMATHSDADCSVGYYGVGIEGALGEAGNISKPLMLHIAENDGFVPAEAQAQIKDALGGNPHATIHSYAGVDHAFARLGGDNFDRAAADLANGRSAEFFARHLG